MRAYFFGNMYLSSIQQGIQATHCLAEIYEKYRDDYPQILPVEAWAKYDKTIILLNAGYSENIRELITFFDIDDNVYPWAYFNEGGDALDGALTCTGIILPKKIYLPATELFCSTTMTEEKRRFLEEGIYIWPNPSQHMEQKNKWEYNDFELELVQRLPQFTLAK